MRIYLITPRIEESFGANIDYTPGRVYSFDNAVTQMYDLSLAIRIENKIDVSALGGNYISGTRIPIRVICQSTPALTVARLEVHGQEKTTVLNSSIPSAPEGSVAERDTLSEIQMVNGAIDVSVRGKEDFERYEFISGYANPIRTRVEFEVTKIYVYATEVITRVSFDMNGGAGAVETFRGKPGTVYSSSQFGYNKPTKDGCLFLGWSENSADKKPQYPIALEDRSPAKTGAWFPGSKTFTMPGQNITLYAVWWKYTYRPLTKNGVIIRSPSNNLILRDGDG